MTIFCEIRKHKDNHVDQYFESLTDNELKLVMDFKNNRLNGYDKAEFYVPNFEFKNKCSLVQSLQRMGMVEAFSSSDGFRKLGPVCISDVVHATYIKPMRREQKAAAATGIGMKTMSARIEEQKLRR